MTQKGGQILKLFNLLCIPFLCLSVPTTAFAEAEDIPSTSTTTTEVIQAITDQEMALFIRNIQEPIGSSFQDKALILENRMVLDEIKSALLDALNDAQTATNQGETDVETTSESHRDARIRQIQAEIHRQAAKGLPVYIIQPGDKISLLAEALLMDPAQIIELNQLAGHHQIPYSIDQLLHQAIDTKALPTTQAGTPSSPQTTVTDDSENQITKWDQTIRLIPGDVLVGLFTAELDVLNQGGQIMSDSDQSSAVNPAKPDDTTATTVTVTTGDTGVSGAEAFNEAKESAKNHILGMNITNDQYNAIMQQLDEAEDIDAVNHIVNWAKEIAAENTTPAPASEDDLASLQDQARKYVQGLTLTPAQLEEVLALINQADTIDAVRQAQAYADSLLTNGTQ